MRTTAALFLLCLALPLAAQPAPDDPGTWAQTAKGVRILGGGASLTTSNSFTSASLRPRVGQFVADNLALSTLVSLGYARSSDDVNTSSSLSLGVGPAVTYYFGEAAGDAVRPFAEADVLLYYTRFGQSGREGSSDTSISGGLAAGVELPIARNVALRGQVFYRASDLTFDTNRSLVGLSAGFSTFLY